MITRSMIAKTFSFGTSGLKLPAAMAVGPLLSFFGMPMFGLLLFLVLVDFLTGLWKAHASRTICSNRFSDALNRVVLYLVIFTVIHAIVLIAPITAPFYPDAIRFMLTSTEYGLFFGYCTKEMLSVFENLKAIQVAKGFHESWIVEMAIDKFGIDVQKTLSGIITIAKATDVPEKDVK